MGLPPSTNHLYEGTGYSRRKTKAYRAFIDLVQIDVLQNLTPGFKAPDPAHIDIRLFVERPVIDLDNVLKPTVDALQHARLIATDAVDSVSGYTLEAYRVESIEERRIEIRLHPGRKFV